MAIFAIRITIKIKNMKTPNLKRVLTLLILATFCHMAQASNVENSINAKYGFSQFDSFENGYYKVWNDLKWGMCDVNGKEIVAPAYDAIWDYKEGFAVVNMGAKWIKTTTPKGVSNLEKEENFKKIWVYDNSNTSAYVYEPTMRQIYKIQGGKYGLIDKNGNEVIAPIYDELLFTSEKGIVKVKQNGKYGYVDINGYNITDIKYDDAYDFSDGMAIVNIGGTPNKRGRISGGKFGYINKDGIEVIKVKYANATPFSDGLATVSEDTDWVVINKSGKKLIDKSFEQLGEYSEGRVAYCENAKYGYLDNNGNKIIDVR